MSICDLCEVQCGLGAGGCKLPYNLQCMGFVFRFIHFLLGHEEQRRISVSMKLVHQLFSSKTATVWNPARPNRVAEPAARGLRTHAADGPHIHDLDAGFGNHKDPPGHENHVLLKTWSWNRYEQVGCANVLLLGSEGPTLKEFTLDSSVLRLGELDLL